MIDKHNYVNYYSTPSLWDKIMRRLGAMPDRWSTMPLGIDISRYQTIIPANWAHLKNDAKIDFVFAKASEGYDWIDPSFATHVQGAYDADIPLMAYHFFRTSYYVEFGHDAAKFPKPADDKQLQNFIHAITNKKYYALVIDVEDTSEAIPWAVWAAGVFAGRVRDWLASVGKNVPVIIYTGEWYWVQAKAEFSWLANYPLWVAKYPYASGIVTTTWEGLRDTYMPPANTSIPTLCCPSWLFWQFSGDKFILPYVTNANGGATALDLNLYNGTRDQLYKWLNFVPQTTPPEPPEPPTPPQPSDVEKRLTALEARMVSIEAYADSLLMAHSKLDNAARAFIDSYEGEA